MRNRILSELEREKRTLTAGDLAERCGCTLDAMMLTLGEMLTSAPRQITCTTVFDEGHPMTEMRFRKAAGARDRR